MQDTLKRPASMKIIANHNDPKPGQSQEAGSLEGDVEAGEDCTPLRECAWCTHPIDPQQPAAWSHKQQYHIACRKLHWEQHCAGCQNPFSASDAIACLVCNHNVANETDGYYHEACLPRRTCSAQPEQQRQHNLCTARAGPGQSAAPTSEVRPSRIAVKDTCWTMPACMQA